MQKMQFLNTDKMMNVRAQPKKKEDIELEIAGDMQKLDELTDHNVYLSGREDVKKHVCNFEEIIKTEPNCFQVFRARKKISSLLVNSQFTRLQYVPRTTRKRYKNATTTEI
ncbi:uncharacterized protein LOC135143108 [Zophobas morio]|uniref:uncharacterized protein LOC135143108 n=1 Tax=Zophobas morio TaxID=2755281 RepID=UPI003083A0BD